jgi:hypothetical protein
MIKTYIRVNVHDDGDTELTKRNLTREQACDITFFSREALP